MSYPTREYFKSYFDPTGQYLCSLIETREFVSQGTTGLQTWPAAEFLLEHLLVDHEQEKMKDKVVLELGSGIGFLGVSLLKKNAVKKLVFTDHHQSVLDILQKNLQANLLPDHQCQVLCLDWGSRSSMTLPCHDYVIGSDIVFDERIIPALVSTLKSCLLKSAKKAIIANEVRNESTIDAFEKALSQAELNFKVKRSADKMLLYEIQQD